MSDDSYQLYTGELIVRKLCLRKQYSREKAICVMSTMHGQKTLEVKNFPKLDLMSDLDLTFMIDICKTELDMYNALITYTEKHKKKYLAQLKTFKN
jgi:hypothetical protein